MRTAPQFFFLINNNLKKNDAIFSGTIASSPILTPLPVPHYDIQPAKVGIHRYSCDAWCVQQIACGELICDERWVVI